MKIVQLQMRVYEEKEKNLAQLGEYLKRTAHEQADIVTVGEMFTCPYQTEKFPLYAEREGEKSWKICSELARMYGVYLCAGSMPEVDENGKIYNTAYVFDRKGEQIAKHRKAHLFDIDIENGQYFKESETLTAGDSSTVFETEFGKMGVCICFDLRFPELSRMMVEQGAKMILVPAAFNMTTGPAHWEILFRSRALDNQCFVAGTSSARDREAGYVAWGHSLLVSPWGDIIEEMEEKEGYISNEINLDYVEKIRKELPLLKARRQDIYSGEV
ncbi:MULTISPECIES: carbon-nitrogen hydrolase family protein [Mediterraneibacter]|jgi:omega-amidase|uniref:carbon-nitrogen hydrolase family protein n=1 Tax=Mediterraneibacter TaxID=2316020 RepID=UPI0022E160A4|nr:carbon-nitrogen hydrolase family protein [Mediterraneibacter massiliensis]